MISKLLGGFAKTANAFKTAYGNKRVAIMAPLGFSSGLPNTLVCSTLPAWLKTEEIDLATIGLFGLFNLSFNLKLFWSPLLDRFNLPWLTRRRDWMLLTQVLLLLAILAMGLLDPSSNLLRMALTAAMIAFLSASQDIAVDAYKVDLLPEEDRPSGTAIFFSTYRIANVIAGSGALILSDHFTWQTTYQIMAGLMAIGIVATLIAPAADKSNRAPVSVRDAVILPWIDFFKRPQAVFLIIIIMTYKVGDFVASAMLIPFLKDIGFSNSDIGFVYKGLGLGATIIGCILGGGLVMRLGLRASLILFGILQAGANAFYMLLATVGDNYSFLVTAIGIDHLFNGLGTTAFGALLLSLCNKKFSATQYALFSSLMTLPGRLIGGGSGFIADAAGWPVFFGITLVAAVPALILLGFVKLDSSDASQ